MHADPIIRTTPANTHGRYIVNSPQPQGRAPLLMGFHGYGENAEIHLRSLARISGADQWITVSVQALHPFYKRTTGEVIASWMTSQDRELAIKENVAYIAGVIDSIRRHHCCDGRLVYAGFSQGAAMAYRAAVYAGSLCDGLIVNGGDVPPDLKEDAGARIPPVLLGRGRRDEWYKQTKMDADLEFFKRRGVSVTPVVFDGGHEWAAEFLEAAGRFLARIKAEES